MGGFANATGCCKDKPIPVNRNGRTVHEEGIQVKYSLKDSTDDRITLQAAVKGHIVWVVWSVPHTLCVNVSLRRRNFADRRFVVHEVV